MSRQTPDGNKNPEDRPEGFFFYPWEKSFRRLISPFEEFIQKETTSGLLLVLSASAALLIANSSLRGAYEALIQTHITLAVGKWSVDWTLLHWVNEGLMAFFFFIVGLEIKREVLVGELSNLKGALLPIFAAVGGMIVPALIYRVINSEGPNSAGWGIPMATDIAFCISTLVILGRRIPKAITVFLVALAIVDDLGAVLVIALFYTQKIEIRALLAAGTLFLILMVLNHGGVRRGWIYLLGGIGLFAFLAFSGIHATIAGVLVGFCIPARARYKPEAFAGRLQSLTARFEEVSKDRQRVLGDMEQGSVLKAMHKELLLAEPLLQRMIDLFHLPVALLIIPVFALMNSGVPIDMGSLGSVLSHPVTLGVVGGLTVGKCVGISLFSWLAVRAGIASLPQGVSLVRHVVGVGLLAGIGFTMSIFISELSFVAMPELHTLSKTGIILGSVMSCILGILWLTAAAWHQKRAAWSKQNGDDQNFIPSLDQKMEKEKQKKRVSRKRR